MKFNRDNLKSKKNYYLILILIELGIYIALFYTNIHWVLLILTFPFLVIEIISNKRCLNRQKNFIKEIEFLENELVCKHLNGNKSKIPFEKLIYSYREIKFEKDKSEIEIREKKRLKSKLVGRLHINNWTTIFEIKNALCERKIVRVKYRPEGFWSKYGGLTADIVITTTVITVGEIAEITGDTQGAYQADKIAFMSDFNNLHKKHKDKASS